ncbi:transcription intermediary factor 1-beta-like [Saccostrea echinata]|uniref:transcription intermediary factor 1-beta-like n=1 Tax=Saccostrea echinata TaxID=191078 RepID=UPI002A829C3E|nr:transcription intermediary factor 1-beta-like [Saccostrea echinata]
MAESGSVQTAEESFSCPICLEQLKIPRYLLCLHTFCEACIQTYISSTAARCEQDALNFIECPVCRKPAVEPRKGVSSEEWVKDLPVNKWILTMSVNTVNESNKYCLFCKRDNITALAKHWCKTCAEPICEDCNRLHRRVPVLQNHKIYCLSDSLKWCEPVDVEEQCSVHKGKLVEVFCRDHNKICCSVCFATLHRTCSYVESIEDVALELDKESVRNKVKSLTDLLGSLDALQDENMVQKERLNKAKEEICLKFEDKVKKAKALIEEAHAQWLKRFDVVHTFQADNIDTVSDELKRFGTTVKEAKTLLSSVLENGSEKQLFITQHRLLSQISAHFDRLKSLRSWDLAETYSEVNSDICYEMWETGQFEDAKISLKSSNALPIVSKYYYLITERSDILPRPKS